MIAGYDHDALVHEVLTVPRHHFVPLPDTQVIQRPGWMQLITPSLRSGGMNEVAHCALEDAEADQVIDETIALYRRLGLRFRWQVGPDSRPADLGERLARRGLRPSEVVGMVRPTAAPPDLLPGVRVDTVDTAMVDLFTDVMARGWEMDPAPLLPLHHLMLRQPAFRLFLAHHRGQPGGVGAMVLAPGSVYLIGAVVLPAFRGRGLYRALVSERLRQAAAEGIALATSQARAETSAPVLARLGFEEVCRLQFYQNA